jgi:Transposase IS116/IS110/IS902 family
VGRCAGVCRSGSPPRTTRDLAAATAEAFAQHPDGAVVDSFPGIGPLTGARVLAEIGDDRTRFRDARGLKSYAGSAPITVASGKSLVVHHRKVKNHTVALLMVRAVAGRAISGFRLKPTIPDDICVRRAADQTSSPARASTGDAQARRARFVSAKKLDGS